MIPICLLDMLDHPPGLLFEVVECLLVGSFHVIELFVTFVAQPSGCFVDPRLVEVLDLYQFLLMVVSQLELLLVDLIPDLTPRGKDLVDFLVYHYLLPRLSLLADFFRGLLYYLVGGYFFVGHSMSSAFF